MNELTGRKLDEACARVLGWRKPSEKTPPRCDICGWPIVPQGEQGCWVSMCSMRPGPERRSDEPSSYSSSHATLGEKLAWLAHFADAQEGEPENTWSHLLQAVRCLRQHRERCVADVRGKGRQRRVRRRGVAGWLTPI